MARYNFGQWIVDTQNLVIEHQYYSIPLGRLLDSAEILDFLAQVNMKTWATADTVRDLLNAIDYCIDLQANVCSSGTSKTTSISAIKQNLQFPPRG